MTTLPRPEDEKPQRIEEDIYSLYVEPPAFHYPMSDMFGNITNWLPYRPMAMRQFPWEPSITPTPTDPADVLKDVKRFVDEDIRPEGDS